MRRCLPVLVVFGAALHAQGVPKFPLAAGPLEIDGPVNPWRFVNAAGEKSGLWGYESGRLEGWVYPLKIFHDFHLTFELEGIPRTYEGDRIVRSVRVYPHAIQLQYAAEQFSVEETLFVPRRDAGFAILLDVRAPAAMRIRARFRPDLNLMWPGGIGGQSAGWDGTKKRVQLEEGSGRFSALIGSPMATGSTALGYHAYLSDQEPYEEIELRVTPEEAKTSYVPIVVTAGIRGIYEASDTYETLLRELPNRFAEAREHYTALDMAGTQFATPDPAVDQALRWSRVALEQLKICNPYLGCGYVSGYGSSGTGTRPMYAWFFDEPVVTTWAYLAAGQGEQLREGFRFIRKYQRADGKTAHEISQSAGVIDWFKDYPYSYIHPDSSAWYLIAMGQFHRLTGDRQFIQESWESIRKAYEYCVSILDPADGLPSIPKGEWGSMETAAFRKDSAMAAEWIAALRALGEIGSAVGDEKLAAECAERKQKAASSLERFWNPALNFYNYGEDNDGHPVTNLNPAIGYGAWFGSLPDERARTVVERLATSSFLADWGQRNMSLEDPRYQEGDYQVGSVWPFMTVGPMLADFRYHHAVQGFLSWMAMIRLRLFNARGSMPEVLSGASYRLLDNSVPHQMFSESAVIPGYVNGVLGLDPDVPHRALRLAPHLPPGWPECSIRQFPYGLEKLGLILRQQPGILSADVQFSGTRSVALDFAPALPMGSEVLSVQQDGKPVSYRVEEYGSDLHAMAQIKVNGSSRIEVRYRAGVAIDVVWHPLLEGDSSSNLRVLRTTYAKPSLEMLVEGPTDRPYQVRLFTPWRVKEGEGVRLLSTGDQLTVVEIFAPEAVRAQTGKAGYVRWTARVNFLQ
jgi:hypothetical protein